jgi:hypothetical protein
MWTLKLIDMIRDGGSILAVLEDAEGTEIELFLHIDHSHEYPNYAGLYEGPNVYRTAPTPDTLVDSTRRIHWLEVLSTIDTTAFDNYDQHRFDLLQKGIQSLDARTLSATDNGNGPAPTNENRQ